MDFAPEPLLDAFTPPPTRAAQPRTPVADDNGQTFDNHLDAVNEPPVRERPALATNETKNEAAQTETKPARADETDTGDEAPDPDLVLLGGPLPTPAPPPMAAPVIVQIAASQPPQQQAAPQTADDGEVAPLGAAPSLPATPPPADVEAAAPAMPAGPQAPSAGKHADTEVKPAAPDTPQVAQQAQQAPVTTPQPTAAPATVAPSIEVQQLPPEVQQAIAQTIAPAQQAPAPSRASAKDTAKPSEAKAEPSARDSKAEATPANTETRAPAPKAAANANIAIDVAAPTTQGANSAADTSQLTQASAVTATATQASTHVQHAATESGAQRAAPAAAQVGREIIRRFDGGNTNFELRLDPAELGRVEVRMEVTRDNRVTAVITADNPQALTELARHARDLEQQLQAAGLQLSDSGLSFDLRQGAQGGDSETSGANGRSDGETAAAEQQQQQQQPVARPIGYERWRGVRVDMMV